MASCDIGLNRRAFLLCQDIGTRSAELEVDRHRLPSGTTAYDFSRAGAAGGLLLARVCLADLAEVSINECAPWPQVLVATDHPLAACMAAQYAGWEIKAGEYFAMGSGPMRAAADREPLIADIGFAEQADDCVGVLETGELPADEVCRDIAAKCGIEPDRLTLLFAPTNSTAGTLQVVTRSVETSLHKLHELGFDLSRVERGEGSAPLPPVARNGLAAIGRTNDAILYGAEVTLGLRGDDASLQNIGPQLPSSVSKEYGQPFADILRSYDNDFYQVDPMLFSPAMITLHNLDTGNKFKFGELNHEVLVRSFADE